MIYTLLALLGLGCGQSTVNPGKNPSPEATITSHQDGDQVFSDTTIELRATISDANNVASELQAEWRIDDQIVCPFAPPTDELGTTLCNTTMAEGESNIKVTVRDPQNATGVDSIDLMVIASEPPTAEITLPASGEVYAVGDSVTIEGTIGDAEDDPADLLASLASDLSGDLGIAVSPDSNGNFSGSVVLDAGSHNVTLSVEDTSGKTATDSIQIVINSRPTCAITFPTTGSSGDYGELVIFAGTASDPDTYPEQLAIEWSSSVDGVLGTNAPDSNGNVSFAYSDLTSATHTISMTATDEYGAQCSSTVIYSVGSPPQIQIAQPTTGTIVNEGDFLTFAATVSDNEDQSGSLAVEWSSSIDGVLASQNADSLGNSEFATSGLSNGEHSITAQVTDSDGLYATDSVYISVNALPTQGSVTLSPDPAYTTDNLIASATGSTDADGDPVVWTYEWLKNSTTTTNTGSVLPNTATTKGEIWTVRATPSDGNGSGPWSETFVTIANSAPVLTAVSLSPANPATQDDITCNYVATDADGDALSATYVWTRNGSTQTSTNATLNGPFQQGDVVQCTVTPTDGQTTASPMSASATISNSSPVISSLSIGPSVVYTDDTLTASVTASDPDGDALSYQWDWHVDDGTGDQVVQTTTTSSTTNSLDGFYYFDRDDSVYVTVSALDGSTSVSQSSTAIAVANTPPVALNVVISPMDPVAGVDDLTCTGSGDDADGDTVTVTYSWEVDGVAASNTGTIVATTDIADGEEWKCLVTPNDGTDDGTAGFATVTIGADLEDATGSTFCASTGTQTDSSGHQLNFCLSEISAVAGTEATDAASNVWQPGSHYLFLPE